VTVLVLGAGLIGVTSAYFLAKAGESVTVVDRQPGPGLETSFANGGQISACHTQPWAHPSTPALALRWLGRDDAPLAIRWSRWDPALWSWGLRFLANCTAGAYDRNMERAVRIALYSRATLKALRAELDLNYDQKTKGILKIYRDPREYEKGLTAMARTEDWGLHQSALDPAACVALEPALARSEDLLAGGILAAEDESGDAHLFTNALFDKARELGVTFLGNHAILGLESSGRKVTGVVTDKGLLRGDRIVLALGSYSPFLARTLGLRLPVYPAKGYSLTLDVANSAAAPEISLTDEGQRMVYSRLGNRLRAAGTAELTGWDTTLTQARVDLITCEAQALFPEAGDYTSATVWCGLRPKTPDSVPIIGAAPGLDNLYINTGHGTLGWTMACGSGKLLSALLTQTNPEIDAKGLGLDRFMGYR
jgi:D-amino-acid dehydrogenase